MSDFQLQTAKYLQSANQEMAVTGAADANLPVQHTAVKVHGMERASNWVSYAAAGAVFVCVAVLAMPLVRGVSLPKSLRPIDWWMWLGGAKDGQTFEKFIQDAATKNKADVEANFKKPAYELGNMPVGQSLMDQMNSQNNWQGQRSFGGR